jgi:hypothetical protein
LYTIQFSGLAIALPFYQFSIFYLAQKRDNFIRFYCDIKLVKPRRTSNGRNFGSDGFLYHLYSCHLGIIWIFLSIFTPFPGAELSAQLPCFRPVTGLASLIYPYKSGTELLSRKKGNGYWCPGA